MSESTHPHPYHSSHGAPTRRKIILLSFTFLIPVLASVLIFQLDPFDPAPLPADELPQSPPISAPLQNPRMLHGAERIGVGRMVGPEDLAYDPISGVIYTGCADGWVKRVRVNESSAAVENWVNTGGRPLGLVVGHNNEVIIADAYKGLLKVSQDGEIELLTRQAEDVDFMCTDGVDIANDGVIYFTDASSKYSLKDFVLDALEGRPYGRLLSYDPSTKQTKVLVRDLYFANGVAVSPDQSFVVFCETPKRRCRRYFVQGERKGSVDKFVDDLPGIPDNIRYDGVGRFWIGLPSGHSITWDLAQKYPFIRKTMAVMEKYSARPSIERNAGVFAVDTQGKPIAHYYDPKLSLITGGIKIQDHFYCSSLQYPFIIRLDLT